MLSRRHLLLAGAVLSAARTAQAESPSIWATSPPEINPLDDYKATFALFYDVVKEQLGSLGSLQFIQIKAVAEQLDISKSYPWFGYYNYLNRTDLLLEPVPVSDTMSASGRTLSEEYGRFVNAAMEFVEVKELDPETIAKIDDLLIRQENCRIEVERLVDRDYTSWEKYASRRGIPLGDSGAFQQWSNAYGHASELAKLQAQILNIAGDIARLRSREFSNPDQKEIKDTYNQVVSPGSRIRYPRRTDTEYPGVQFSLPYLAGLPYGSTALYDDRHVVFPDRSIEEVTSGTIGAFSVQFDRHREASSAMSQDWGVSGGASYGWFSVSANASSHTQISEDFRKTSSVTIGAKSCSAIPANARPWFTQNLFKNKIIVDNAASFGRYFGAAGTLLYYPVSLIVVRGFTVKFKSSQSWTYDYQHNFSTGGSGSMRAFGIGWGGGYSYSESHAEHKVEQSGDELIFSDGDNTLRVIGFVAQKNQQLIDSINSELINAHGGLK